MIELFLVQIWCIRTAIQTEILPEVLIFFALSYDLKFCISTLVTLQLLDMVLSTIEISIIILGK